MKKVAYQVGYSSKDDLDRTQYFDCEAATATAALTKFRKFMRDEMCDSAENYIIREAYTI